MKKFFIFGILIVTIFLVFGAVLFYSISKEETPTPSSPESISDTVSSSQSDNSVSTWNAETASFKKYESYEEYERESEEMRNRELIEYNNAIKGTIVEQVQNIAIPSYDDEEPLVQLRSGEIVVRAPESDDFPNGVLLWLASLKRDVRSFSVCDFNKDGLNDVAHIIGYSGGGSGYFYHLMIFVNDHGKLKYLTDEYVGDRVVIKGVRYESGLFVVDMITQGEGEDFMGYCCPNIPATIKFKLESDHLVET